MIKFINNKKNTITQQINVYKCLNAFSNFPQTILKFYKTVFIVRFLFQDCLRPKSDYALTIEIKD